MSNKKILIVEDDADVRKGLHVRLKANHYDIFFPADGFASVQEARKHEPDLIILDLGLPAGDSFVVMDRLKAVPALAIIPIIVVSGRSGAANRERALKAGAKAFLEKPVDNAELLAVIRQALGPWGKLLSAKDLWCTIWARCNIAGIRSIISSGVVVDDAYGALQIVTAGRRCAATPDLYRASFFPLQDG